MDGHVQGKLFRVTEFLSYQEISNPSQVLPLLLPQKFNSSSSHELYKPKENGDIGEGKTGILEVRGNDPCVCVQTLYFVLLLPNFATSRFTRSSLVVCCAAAIGMFKV